MIRKNILYCKLIRIKKSSKELFDSYIASFRPDREVCPTCGSVGNCRVHGYYTRKIIDFVKGKPVTAKIQVMRLLCTSCGHTHAVLPDVIIPYFEHGLFFILRVLTEAAFRRCSVERLCERFAITRNQFREWKQLFKRHKREWLGILEASETSDRTFLKKLVMNPKYSLFALAFAEKTACSFLQSHENPKIRPRKAAHCGLT